MWSGPPGSTKQLIGSGYTPGTQNVQANRARTYVRIKLDHSNVISRKSEKEFMMKFPTPLPGELYRLGAAVLMKWRGVGGGGIPPVNAICGYNVPQ